jgi:ABC-type transporter Mla MlaB component
MLNVRTIDRPPEATLRLEGELRGLEVAELDRVAGELLASGRNLRLDLEELTYLDRDGVTLLQGLRADGAVWENASTFVLCLLEGG